MRLLPLAANSSGVIDATELLRPSSPCWLLTGMRRAWGRKSDRKRSQSRASPASPEMASYTAVMMASIDSTSAGSAIGSRRHLGDLGGGRLGFGQRVVGAGFGRGAPEREGEDRREERLAHGVGG